MDFEILDYEENDSKLDYLDFIPVLDNNITYNEFFQTYLLKNQACLIKNISSEWESTKLWISDAKINFKYLSQKYGQMEVTIYDCESKYHNSQNTSFSTFSEYLNYWESYRKSDYSKDFPLHYLKDWHLKNKIPDDNFYEVPIFFKSDWLNEYLVENDEDDYRFVYMGPLGSWTPFHADVFTSYSWSINIFGQKRWILLPPGEEIKLEDNLGNLPFDISELKSQTKHFEIIQNEGDAIFVPSGWYHQVWNLKDTISINHNWINACNLKNTWLSIVNNLKLVKKEIADCKEMDDFTEQCQILLKASFGWDFAKFYDFIKYISLKRIRTIENNETNSVLRCKLDKKHAMFDLRKIQIVLALYIKNPDVIILDDLDLLMLIENCINLNK